MIVSIAWVLIIVITSLFIHDIKMLRYLSKFLAVHGLYYGTNLTVCFGLPLTTVHQYVLYLNMNI